MCLELRSPRFVKDRAIAPKELSFSEARCAMKRIKECDSRSSLVLQDEDSAEGGLKCLVLQGKQRGNGFSKCS